MTTPIQSKVIPSGFRVGESRQKEEAVFGVFIANRYQSLMFRLMDQFSAGAYNGGMWELHEYENGAVAWIFPDDQVIQTRTLNGYDPECSMRTLSLALNMIAMSALMAELSRQPDSQKVLDRVVENFELLGDVGFSLAESNQYLRIID